MPQSILKTWLVSLTCVFVAAFLVNRTIRADDAFQRFEYEERHMGTLFRIILYAPDQARADQAAKQAFARIAGLDQILSDYKDDSELMKLCRQAGGPAVPVSDDLFKVLQQAQEISTKTGGAFDVTVGPAVRLWRRARRTREMPSPQDLAKAVKLCDFRAIQLDPAKMTVRLTQAGILIDLGGIAKGYAADAALEVLRGLGLSRALVAAGGDVATLDPPPGSAGWKVAIGNLKEPGAKAEAYLSLSHAAVSTSGDAEQFVTIDGKRYSHIVDPKTGVGLLGRRSVSILAARGTLADGLATAVCVQGLQQGAKLLEGWPGVSGLLVFEEDGELQRTRIRWPEAK